jgi:hypothetical protein
LLFDAARLAFVSLAFSAMQGPNWSQCIPMYLPSFHWPSVGQYREQMKHRRWIEHVVQNARGQLAKSEMIQIPPIGFWPAWMDLFLSFLGTSCGRNGSSLAVCKDLVSWKRCGQQFLALARTWSCPSPLQDYIFFTLLYHLLTWAASVRQCGMDTEFVVFAEPMLKIWRCVAA